MKVEERKNKLKEILEYFAGFNGRDATLSEIDQELHKLYYQDGFEDGANAAASDIMNSI